MRIGIMLLGDIKSDAGGKIYVKNVIEKMVRQDRINDYVLFISDEDQDIYETKNYDNVTKIFFPISCINKFLRVIFEQLFFPLIIKKYRVDIMFCPLNFAPFLCPVKTVLTIHSVRYFHYPSEDYLIRRIYRKLMVPLSARRSKMVLTVSNSLKEDVIKFMNVMPENIKVVYLGIDSDMFKAVSNVKERNSLNLKDYILFVSALRPYKNVETLLKAFTLVRQEQPQLKLVIVGSYYEQYEPLVENLGLKDVVIFTGPLEHKQVSVLYRHCLAFAFPSKCESFGIPLVEAMASGAPLIVANAHAMPEIAGDAGLLFEPEDYEKLTQLILRIVCDTELRTNMIAKGIERSKHFSWELTAQDTLNALTEAYYK